MAIKVLNEVQADTLFVTVASDTMAYIYGVKELAKIIQTWIERTKQLNGILIMFQFGHENLRLPTQVASSYLKFENIGGNILFYGEIPKTKMYITSFDISERYMQTRFIPIE
jgi:hypothetical protein